VKAGKVLTNGFTFPMKPLLNGGDLEKSRLPNNDSMACHLSTLYMNHESLCLPNQCMEKVSLVAWLTKKLHHKLLQITMLYLSQRSTFIVSENVILHCLQWCNVYQHLNGLNMGALSLKVLHLRYNIYTSLAWLHHLYSSQFKFFCSNNYILSYHTKVT